MINRVTGEIDFSDGLRILPHCTVNSLSTAPERPLKGQIQKLSLGDWKRHVLGSHSSEHGDFEVEALSADGDCVHVVLLSHQHRFYEAGTSEDAERRAFHEGVVASDLGGQGEFAWKCLPTKTGSSLPTIDSRECLCPRRPSSYAYVRMKGYPTLIFEQPALPSELILGAFGRSVSSWNPETPASTRPDIIRPDVNGNPTPLAGKVQEIASAKLSKILPRKSESANQS